jgi:hypothetical protein
MDNNNSNFYGQDNSNSEQSQFGQQYQQGQTYQQDLSQKAEQQPYQQQSYQQQTYQQQPYQQPYQQQYQQQPYIQNEYKENESGLEEPVSFGEWMLTMLLMYIPCVNIIMIFVWAFGSGAKKSKSNYFKAVLTWAVISIVVSVVIIVAVLLLPTSFVENF